MDAERKPEIILGIDPATRCGWAWKQLGADGLPAFNVWDYSNVCPSGTPNASGHRLSAFREDLSVLIAEHGITRVAYEDAHFGAINRLTAAFHAEMRGVIHMVCARHAIPCKGYKPNSIKLFWAGHGHAQKPQMMSACRTWLGITVDDPDAADALAVLHMAIDELRVDGLKERVAAAVPSRPRRRAAKAGGQKSLFARR